MFLCIRLLESGVGYGWRQVGGRDGISLKEATKVAPRYPSIAFAAAKPLMPNVDHQVLERRQRFTIPSDAVVLVVPAYLANQCDMLVSYGLVPMTTTPIRDRSDPTGQTVACRLLPNNPSTFPRSSPVKGEPEQIERIRCRPPIVLILRSMEPNESSFVRVARESKLGKTFG